MDDQREYVERQEVAPLGSPLRHFWWRDGDRGGMVAVCVFDVDQDEPRILIEVVAGCHPQVAVLPRLLAALGGEFRARVNALSQESPYRVMVEARGRRLGGDWVGGRKYLVHHLVATRLMATRVSGSLTVSRLGRWRELYLPLADLASLVEALAAEFAEGFDGVLRESAVPAESDFESSSKYRLGEDGRAVLAPVAELEGSGDYGDYDEFIEKKILKSPPFLF